PRAGRPIEERAAAPMKAVDSREDAERLKRLIAERAGAVPEANYLVGPNDLLAVSVFDLAEMDQKGRVDSEGNIQLPLIGQIHAAGLTAPQIAKAIPGPLAAFVHAPQVNVFILEYKSQEVAVSGSVAKPGLYPLMRE